MKGFDEVFDLPYQQKLRADIHASVEKLGNDDDWELTAVMSDLESILTFYCKSKNCEYDSSWIDLLLPLLSLKVKRAGKKLRLNLESAHTFQRNLIRIQKKLFFVFNKKKSSSRIRKSNKFWL